VGTAHPTDKIVMSSFNSCKNKYYRAQTHLKSLEQRIKVIQRANLKRVTVDYDANTGEKIFLYDGRPRQLHSSVSLIIGDSIHNYRSALDHLAYSLVEANQGKPPDKTAFPISTKPNGYKDYFNTKTKGMSDQAKKIIENEQPINAKNQIRGNRLALLKELDDIDKHRHIHITLTAIDGGVFVPGLPVLVGTSNSYFIHTGPIIDKTILARIPKEYKNVNFIPSFDISFESGVSCEGESVISILIAFDQLVAEIINRFDSVLPLYH
jgi:hypothetical protein